MGPNRVPVLVSLLKERFALLGFQPVLLNTYWASTVAENPCNNVAMVRQMRIVLIDRM